MDKKDLKVSVIICAYTIERLKDIFKAAESVLAQTLKPYEVIVSVDHNEELFNLLKTKLPQEVKVVLNTGAPGVSHTRNIGILASSGEIVAFIDDDAIAEKDWLKKLTTPFYDPQVVAVGGRAIPIWPNGKRPYWFPEELDWTVGCTYKGLPLEGNKIRNVPGCNMAFRREVFEQVGLWQDRLGSIGQSFLGGEEAELCLRIKHKMPNRYIIYEPSSVIHHQVLAWRMNLGWLLKRSFDQGVAKAKVRRYLSNLRSQSVLSVEKAYLRYLIFRAVPERLKQIYKWAALTQIGVLLLCMVATLIGYLITEVQNRAIITFNYKRGC